MNHPNPQESAIEKIEYIATKVMGWTADKKQGYWFEPHPHGLENAVYPIADILWDGDGLEEGWTPQSNWSHWRDVEEKIMESGNEALEKAFIEKLVEVYPGKEPPALFINIILGADLPARIDSLISAHRSLQ